jgi:hypothetical protein
VLALLPWTLRNAAVTDGQFIGISSNVPGEFLRGYINAQPKYFLLRQNFGGFDSNVQTWDPEANLYETELLLQHGVTDYRVVNDDTGHSYAFPPMPQGMTSAKLEVEKDRIEGAEMKRLVLHNPAGLLYKFAIQLATFWYVVETPAKSVFVGGIALVVLALAAIGILRSRREGTVAWPVVAIVLYVWIIYAATLAFARYSMPVYPTLLVLSAGGLAHLARIFFRRFRRPSSRLTPSQTSD